MKKQLVLMIILSILPFTAYGWWVTEKAKPLFSGISKIAQLAYHTAWGPNITEYTSSYKIKADRDAKDIDTENVKELAQFMQKQGNRIHEILLCQTKRSCTASTVMAALAYCITQYRHISPINAAIIAAGTGLIAGLGTWHRQSNQAELHTLNLDYSDLVSTASIKHRATPAETQLARAFARNPAKLDAYRKFVESNARKAAEDLEPKVLKQSRFFTGLWEYGLSGLWRMCSIEHDINTRFRQQQRRSAR